jgi:hypothetical protein
MKVSPKPKPSTTRADALIIFHQRYPPHIVSWFEVTDTLPERCKPLHLFYHPFPDCWFILFSLPERPALQSSRLFAVAKRDGAIVYDGSANDEG